MKQKAWMTWGVLCVLPLAGCDQLKERAGIHDPAKVEAEGKAIGSACRHAGWGIEDCFRLNAAASKPAMFAGWKDMNEYMLKNNMEAMEPTVSPTGQPMTPRKGKKTLIELEPVDPSKVEEPGHVGEKPAEKTGEKAAEQPAGKSDAKEAKAGPQKKEAPAR